MRVLTGAALIAAALLASYAGGNVFAFAVAAIATAMFYEWTRIVRGWGAAWYVSGFVYALLPGVALLWIRERDAHGLDVLLWVFLVTWSTDIGAYFVGRAIGRRKLAPSISPGKTVEGLLGGMAVAAVIAGAWALGTGLGATLLFLAPLFALAAQGGDLFESWMKRRAGIKDSGTWLPGHGGILDRVDALLVTSAVTFLYSIWFLTRGAVLP